MIQSNLLLSNLMVVEDKMHPFNSQRFSSVLYVMNFAQIFSSVTFCVRLL
jgi:hypothetical protein